MPEWANALLAIVGVTAAAILVGKLLWWGFIDTDARWFRRTYGKRERKN